MPISTAAHATGRDIAKRFVLALFVASATSSKQAPGETAGKFTQPVFVGTRLL